MPLSPGRRYWREDRPLLRGSIGHTYDGSRGFRDVAIALPSTTSRSRCDSVSATAKRRAAGLRSSPNSGYDTSYPERGSVPSAAAAHLSRSS